MSRHDDMLRLMKVVHSALIEKAKDRNYLTWPEDERTAMAVAANQWAEAHGMNARITANDIERIEVTAVGHTDYDTKIAALVAEFIFAKDVPS